MKKYACSMILRNYKDEIVGISMALIKADNKNQAKDKAEKFSNEKLSPIEDLYKHEAIVLEIEEDWWNAKEVYKCIY